MLGSPGRRPQEEIQEAVAGRKEVMHLEAGERTEKMHRVGQAWRWLVGNRSPLTVEKKTYFGQTRAGPAP